jgi:hypothetical protein
MNRYKVDYNTYGHDFPYALFGKLGWFAKWQQIGSFKTKEEAIAYGERLQGLPIHMPQVRTA